jgi:hypothetical protein
MKRILFISLLLVLAVISCDKEDVSKSQADSFIKFYRNYSEFTAADVTQNGSGYALLGTAKTNTLGTQICLIRTDEYGNSLDSAFYGRSLDDHAYCLKVMDDGGFAILGSSKNPDTEKLEVYFIRTDSEGNIKWSRTIANHTIAGIRNVEAKHFEINDDGSFIMIGYAENASNVKQIWLGALDKDGIQPYWSPKINPSAKDAEGRHLQILDDGHFVITGTSKNNSANADVYILKTTSSGGLEDSYFLSSAADDEGNCIRILDNDHFLVLSTTKSAAGTDIALNYVSFTIPHQVAWRKTYSSSGNNIGRSMLLDGSSIYILGTTGTTGTNTAISLITTDASGNQTGRSDFGLGSKLSGSSFEQTSDGGFIIVGTNYHSAGNVSVALIKTKAGAVL